MGNQWVAEDVPWYMIDKDQERPWRDEDVAMSSPTTVYKGDYENCLRAMHNALNRISEMNHVQRSGEAALFRSAAQMFYNAMLADNRFPHELGVRIAGRYHRVRPVTN